MRIIQMKDIKAPHGEVATFQGLEHEANISFFIVTFSPGKGPSKHRHPYEETFIILDGEIEAIVDGETQVLGSDTIAIISAGTWHEFKNRSAEKVSMVNIHPVLKMITEWA